MLDPTLEAEGLGPSAFSEALALDWASRLGEIEAQIAGARVLVVGAAGTIGAAVARQLLALGPALLELVDIDENGLARLARDIRSRGEGERTKIGFNVLDFGASPGLALAQARGPFDLVLNFAAVKHVRSEKNLFTLLHMIDVNVVRQHRFARRLAEEELTRRLFVVSTDKAADPASFMGATKRLMEAAVFAATEGPGAPAATAARFANVAFSSGSLLESYLQRFAAGQALATPRETRRYFISARDGARICLIAQSICPSGRIAIPSFDPASAAWDLADTAAAFLRQRGRTPVFVESAQAAAALARDGGDAYPVILTARDTAGEKPVEVFRGAGEIVEPLPLGSLAALQPTSPDPSALAEVVETLAECVLGERQTSPAEIQDLLRRVIPNFRHVEAKSTLDERV
jgi:FlaA1/EpsC-like NDP-sugar epimerase